MGKQYSVAEARQNLASILRELEIQPLMRDHTAWRAGGCPDCAGQTRQIAPGGGDIWAAITEFHADADLEDFDPDEVFADLCATLRLGRDVDLS